jgi:hypothetical protein
VVVVVVERRGAGDVDGGGAVGGGATGSAWVHKGVECWPELPAGRVGR